MRFIQKLSYACFNILCILFFCLFSFSGIKSEAYDTIQVIIPVSCSEILEDDTHTYEINIEKQNDIAPQPKSDKLTILDNGTAEFEIEITEPGTYLYKVYEKSGDDTNVIYDDTVYDITVFVTNTEDYNLTYAISVRIAGEDSKSDSLIFEDILSNKVVVTTPNTDTTDIITQETSSITTTESTTTSTESTTSSVITSTPSDNTTITNLVHNFMTGDFTPIKLLFAVISISITIASIMIIIKKKE